ncbi:hypothetical protein [Undibacterium sp. Di24W]|uniref:hypothetical protein n=1 Tax=Undibacterium sp. Di24W TaxID=3413033 RepID=UPI003BF51159
MKPDNFWVTDFLAQRLMDVELTFCCGETENMSTVRLCAEYSKDLLGAIHPDVCDLEESLELTSISSCAKEDIRELFALDASVGAGQVTTEQACNAVSAFLKLVFTRELIQAKISDSHV